MFSLAAQRNKKIFIYLVQVIQTQSPQILKQIVTRRERAHPKRQQEEVTKLVLRKIKPRLDTSTFFQYHQI